MAESGATPKSDWCTMEQSQHDTFHTTGERKRQSKFGALDRRGVYNVVAILHGQRFTQTVAWPGGRGGGRAGFDPAVRLFYQRACWALLPDFVDFSSIIPRLNAPPFNCVDFLCLFDMPFFWISTRLTFPLRRISYRDDACQTNRITMWIFLFSDPRFLYRFKCSDKVTRGEDTFLVLFALCSRTQSILLRSRWLLHKPLEAIINRNWIASLLRLGHVQHEGYAGC